MSDRTPIQHLELWRFEEREAQRDAAEHENDLRQESLQCEEREASGYWDDYPEEEA